MTDVTIALVTKDDCHLCDIAKTTIDEVMAAERAKGVAVNLEVFNIAEDAELARAYATDVPVVMVGEHIIGRYKIPADRLTKYIERAAAE